MLTKLRLNLSEKIDRKVEKAYHNYRQSKLKSLDKELATLIAQEKALLRKLLPLQAKIEAKKQEKTKLQRNLSSL
jgi:predicted  nucleic acid-binding Zn-ribbon protein